MIRPLIQCVVVLYQQTPSESRALSALLEVCRSNSELAARIAILVQDNTPTVQEFDAGTHAAGHSIAIEYRHATENPGLAAAYNSALDLAEKRNIPWLLLLDQDTSVTGDFLIELQHAIEQFQANECCAFVPKLVSDGLILSPQVVGKVSYHRIPPSLCGLTSRPLVAFNSAACLQVQSVRGIGGFPKEFWLDYLDHMVFHRLQAEGGRVFILHSRLEHRLSLQNIESEVSIERYTSVLAGEWKFVRESGWGGGSLVHRLRLLKRAVNHSFTLRNKRYALQVLRSALS